MVSDASLQANVDLLMRRTAIFSRVYRYLKKKQHEYIKPNVVVDKTG
jgi:hypothetical protein